MTSRLLREFIDIVSEALADTPAFRQWFKGSQVVDDEGQPLIVYHGTRASEFAEFSPLSHFGTNAAAHDRLSDTRAIRGAHGEQIIPVYLAIKNPVWVWDDPGLARPSDLMALAVDHDGEYLFSKEERAAVGDDANALIQAIERLGYESGLYDTYIRTDSNIISKHPKMTTGEAASGGPSLA